MGLEITFNARDWFALQASPTQQRRYVAWAEGRLSAAQFIAHLQGSQR
ncbi:hypothetical protein LCGC14_1485010 [marine sediment metagenome]|uniref:Uncharacterized protein n=1 Tax=marine sediment metagenome TaxID=412755 RepID=A0A0F9JUA2_9ZZZZ